jgi:hypothetical protein
MIDWILNHFNVSHNKNEILIFSSLVDTNVFIILHNSTFFKLSIVDNEKQLEEISIPQLEPNLWKKIKI